MGIIRDILGGGLVGLRKITGILLILLALLMFSVALGENNLVGYLFTIILGIIGVGLFRFNISTR